MRRDAAGHFSAKTAALSACGPETSKFCGRSPVLVHSPGNQLGFLSSGPGPGPGPRRAPQRCAAGLTAID